MRRSKSESSSRLVFRHLAEEKIRTEEAAATELLSLEEAQQLLYELRVHQIELEMQNDELRHAQHELSVSRARYFELYDLAPVGYLTVSARGIVLDANLTAATLLGFERKKLLRKPLTKFVFREDQDIYYRQRKEVYEADKPHIWEMRLMRADGSPFWARLQAASACGGEYWITLSDIGAQKNVEEEKKIVVESLRRQHSLLSSLINNIPMGVFMVEVPSGKPLVANDAALKLLGRGILPDASRFNLSQVYKAIRLGSDETYPVEEMPIMLGMKGVKSYVDDMVVERPDGSKVQLEIFGSPLLDEDGQIFASLACFSDITERKLDELVLKARLRISDFALNHSLDELLTKIIDEAEALTASQIGFFHFVDEDQINLSLQTWSTKTVSSFCTAEVKDKHYSLESAGIWADCIRQRKALIHNSYGSLSGRKGLPPGHATLHREVIVPIFRNNKIVAVLGVGNKQNDYTVYEMMRLEHFGNLVWDIVKRKKLEKSLQSTELKYSRLFESMTDAYCCVDMKGRIIESNALFETLTGYDANELSSLSYVQLTPKKWHAYETELVEQQVLKRGYSDVYQKEYQRKDGSLVDIELKTFLLKDDQNKPEGMWAIIRNITERKRAELELHQSKEAAEAANRAKSDFLATMSHEIRTPLGAMLGNIDMLEASQLSRQQLEYLHDCKAASRMLLQVINDVLDYSKIEAGKLELESEIFSIASMAIQLVRIFSASAGAKGLELGFSMAENLPAFIVSDQQRLRQIISNLIGNAIKFTTKGKISLEISSGPPFTDDSHDKILLRIVVKDTGVGIAADKLDYIFDSFTQIGGFTTRSSAGTGLGLPICRRLLDLMGGNVTVASVLGEGSVFTVTVPVVIPQVQSLAPSPVPVISQVYSRKLLLADDDKMGRTIAQKLLQRKGHKVTTVDSGRALLDALQRAEFEIILTDISMPDLDGTEVAKIIRSGKLSGVNCNIPIIAMTAHAFNEDRDQFMAAGINGYIAKPVNLDLLLNLIESLCNKEHVTN